MRYRQAGTCHFFSVLGSTQDAAWRLREAGAPSGTLVLAGAQTSGRGRYGRAWCSPPGGLWFSLLLYPLPAGRTALLTREAVRSLRRTLARAPGFETRIKPPNDLYLGERKLAGVLLEVRGETAVLGVGLNVNCPTAGFPCAAASVREATGARASRRRILVGFLDQLRVEARLELPFPPGAFCAPEGLTGLT